MSIGRLPISALALTILLTFSSTGCVVKDDPDRQFDLFYSGLEEWSLELKERRATLDFRFGYLIGLQDPDTIQAITWRYRLVTKDELELARFEEEMRAASPDKTQLFVQGDRSRQLEIDTPLEPGVVYVLWFELDYKGERLHETLFPVIAGESGGDPDWAEIYEESI
ncbi:MAG: hypothetical protein VYD19_00050 [Myxococcota bacterium]|nr:hypothetical protein [Myxococcota bacterium]